MLVYRDFLSFAFYFCGETGIRTPGTSQYNGFQDRRNRPLCHLSKTSFQKCFLLKAVQRYEDILNMQEFSQKNNRRFPKDSNIQVFYVEKHKIGHIYADYMKNDCNFVRSKEKDNYNL